MRLNCTCSSCGQKRDCHVDGVAYAQRKKQWKATGGKGGAEAVPAPEAALCGDCLGKPPAGTCAWLWWVLAIAAPLTAYGIYGLFNNPPDTDLRILMAMSILFGYFLNVIGVFYGMLHLMDAKGTGLKGILVLLIAMIASVTLIPTVVLFIMNRAVRRNAFAGKRLAGIVSGAGHDSASRMDSLIKRASEPDGFKALTGAEKEEVAKHAAQEKARQEQDAQKKLVDASANYRGAFLGILITIGLAIYGANAYSTGYIMKWFGIELNREGFTLLIIAFCIYDVIRLIIANRRIRKEKDALAARQAEPDGLTGWNPPSIQDEEDYLRRCVNQEFEETDEARKYNDSPQCTEVLNLFNAGKFFDAAKMAIKVTRVYKDFDLPYKWAGSSYIQLMQYEKAVQVIAEGLKNAKRKVFLLTDMGNAQWQNGSFDKAFFAWAQAMHCLCKNRADYNAYLYMGCVAKAYGMYGIAANCHNIVDSMRSGRIRLSSEEENKLAVVATKQKRDAYLKILEELNTKYL
jgi:hypothetical protein